MQPSYDTKDPYKILQVDRGAESEVIAAAYRSLAKRYHPDMNPGPEASERMKEINWAFDLLSDPVKRATFDNQYAELRGPTFPQHFSSRPVDDETVARAVYETLRREGMTCQGCGDVAPIRKVRFRRNVGMVFMRQTVEIEGSFCRRCIENKFWEFTGKLLLFGWWGILSFFITWYYLIANLFTYLGSLTLDNGVEGLWKTAFRWKLTSIAVVAVLVWILSGASLPGSIPVAADFPAPTPWSASVAATKTSVPPTHTLYPAAVRPTSRPVFTSTPDCWNWRQVTLSQVGRTLCVAGIVANSYHGSSADAYVFYIAFGNGKGDFYMVDYNGYFEGLNGKCVYSTGKIEQVGDSPYMIIVNHRLDSCK
jgi:hypothetical protein